jgi:hypothetical protein
MVKDSTIRIEHSLRALHIFHNFLMDQEDLEVTPILAETSHINILCFYDSSPDNISKLKKATSDPSKELQLYLETWSDKEPYNWVITRYSATPNARFENKVLKTMKSSIDESIEECVSREYYEEAHLLQLLKHTFDL